MRSGILPFRNRRYSQLRRQATRSGVTARRTIARSVSASRLKGSEVLFVAPWAKMSPAQCGNIGGVSGSASLERRGASDKHSRTCRTRKSRRFRRDTAIHLKVDVATRFRDPLRRRLELPELTMNEFLASEAGVDAHDEDQVHEIEHIVERIHRRARIENNSGPLAVGANQLK